MREEFEKLPKVAEVIKKYDGYRIGNKYSTYDTAYTAWLNGAWYAFQEQQKKIDALTVYKDQLLEDIENMS